MGIWELVVGIFVLLFSVIMIIVIILQEGHESNLGAITGGADSFLSRGKAKTADAIFAKFTKYCAIAFFVLVVLLNALSYFDIKGNSISGSDAEPETEDNPHSDLPHPDLPRPDEPDAVEHRQYNNNKYNNNKNNINQYQSIYPDADEINEIREEVKDQIDYDYACMKFGEEKVDGIVDLMMEVYLSVGTICIGKKQLLAEQVKNVFRKINMDHIQYVFNSIEQTSREKKIKNMKSYLLTALYNAPMTIEAYYASESNYDYHNQEEG